jgi:CheY-like chemotaxis protein
MKSYLPKVGFDGFGVDAAYVLKEIWEREHRSGGVEKRIVLGTDFSEVRARRAERGRIGGVASSPFADAIFAVVDDLIKPGSSGEDHRHALQLAMVALSMPYGDRGCTREALLQLPQSLREKQALLSALVLGGEIIQTDMVLDGLRGLLEEAKTKPWLLPDQNGWEIEGWLKLLPFSDRPMATLDGLELIEANRRQPWRLRSVLWALAYAPSSDAEDVLKAMARKDTEFLREHAWLNALERRGPITAARTLLEFISEGAFSSVPGGDGWWLSRKLAGAMRAEVTLRAEVYRQYKVAPAGVGREMLEAAIAEAADEEGVLILVRNHAAQGKPFSGNMERAIRHAAVGERPSSDWAGASELFGIAVTALRKALFAMIEGDTPEGRLAKECLTAIDRIRDEYGPVESEPRHPDIGSGRPWPVPPG